MKKSLLFGLLFVWCLSLCGGALAQNSAAGLTLTPITWEGVGLGKVAVPKGYKLSTEVHCSDETTCLGSPIRVSVALASMEDSAILMFSATETYIERVSTNYPSILKHVDGKLDKQTMIFMRRYLDAKGYCDAQVKDLTYPVLPPGIKTRICPFSKRTWRRIRRSLLRLSRALPNTASLSIGMM